MANIDDLISKLENMAICFRSISPEERKAFENGVNIDNLLNQLNFISKLRQQVRPHRPEPKKEEIQPDKDKE